MARLQRRTSILTLVLVIVSLTAGGMGCGWYMESGIVTAVGAPSGNPSSGSSEMAYGLVWAQVYLASLLASLVLVVFAARGLRLVCFATTVLAALAGPFLAVFASDLVGA